MLKRLQEGQREIRAIKVEQMQKQQKNDLKKNLTNIHASQDCAEELVKKGNQEKNNL